MENISTEIYWYCTDFCINAANLLGISYVGFNFILFLIVFPAVLLLLLFLNFRLLWRKVFVIMTDKEAYK